MNTETNNSNPDFDKSLAARLNAETRQAADDLDMATRSKLNQARQQALTQLDKPAWRRGAILAPAGAMAAALLVAVIWLQATPPTTNPVIQAELTDNDKAQDMEILLAGDDLALYADLEFYLWLEAESNAG